MAETTNLNIYTGLIVDRIYPSLFYRSLILSKNMKKINKIIKKYYEEEINNQRKTIYILDKIYLDQIELEMKGMLI